MLANIQTSILNDKTVKPSLITFNIRPYFSRDYYKVNTMKPGLKAVYLVVDWLTVML